MHYIRNLIGNPSNPLSDLLLTFLLVTSIIGFLTIRKWTNTCLFLILALSIFHLKSSFLFIKSSNLYKHILPVLIILTLPIIAIFFSQLGRENWLLRAYDAPSRMFFSIPIFLFFLLKKINYSYLIGLTAPLTLLITLISILLHPEAVANWGGRYATTFVDPNTLGTYSVLFTSFCLINIDLNYKSSKRWNAYQLSGIFVGLIIITGNGTRGSWLALPLIFAIWLYLNFRHIKKLTLLILFLSAFLFLAALSHYFPNSSNRIAGIFSVLTNWDNFSNLDQSVHIRISMWKDAWQLFLQHPLWGYGDHNLAPFLNSSSTSLPVNINSHGPHNELLANALRSGFLGIIAALALLTVPLTVFVPYTYFKSEDVSRAAKLGLIYIISLTICSMTLEVFNLKYTSSFYGLLISGLIAQIINAETNLKQS